MSFIETRDGQTVFSQKEILDEKKFFFYENLYSQKELLMLIGEHYYQMPHHLHMRKEKLLKDK